MDKHEIFSKIAELRKLQRKLEDLATELEIGDISNDKIYVAINTYRISLIRFIDYKEVDE